MRLFQITKLKTDRKTFQGCSVDKGKFTCCINRSVKPKLYPGSISLLLSLRSSSSFLFSKLQCSNLEGVVLTEINDLAESFGAASAVGHSFTNKSA